MTTNNLCLIKGYNLIKTASYTIVASFPIPQIPLKPQMHRSELNVEANLIVCIYVQWWRKQPNRK